jgi:hypothetical protein
MAAPTPTTEARADTTAFLYAEALLLKLYKARVISRRVFESAKEKCRGRLCAG